MENISDVITQILKFKIGQYITYLHQRVSAWERIIQWPPLDSWRVLTPHISYHYNHYIISLSIWEESLLLVSFFFSLITNLWLKTKFSDDSFLTNNKEVITYEAWPLSALAIIPLDSSLVGGLLEVTIFEISLLSNCLFVCSILNYLPLRINIVHR